MAKGNASISKISVWWDAENCHVPKNVDPHLVAQNLGAALRHANLEGPISIDMFGDTRCWDNETLQALSSTGITINHIPKGNKDASDKAILVSMLFWALDNPPPAHLVLISGDGDFANALHRLRLKGYNILLVRPDQTVKPALLGAATTVLFWTKIAKGQLSGSGESQRSLSSTYVEGQFLQQFIGDRSSNMPASESLGMRRQNEGNDSSLQPYTFESGSKAASIKIQLTQNQETPDERQPVKSKRGLSVINAPMEMSKCDSSDESTSKGPGLSKVHSKVQLETHNTTYFGVSNPTNDQFFDAKTNTTPDAVVSCSEGEFKPLSTGKMACNSGYNAGKPTQFREESQKFLTGNKTARDYKSLSSNTPAGNSDRSAIWPSHEQPHMSEGAITESPLECAISPVSSIEKPQRLSQNHLLAHKLSVDEVMKALNTLKSDCLMPTETNLQNCLCYWNKQHEKVNLRQMLEKAVDLQQIEVVQAGERGFSFFLPQNSSLWNCVNTGDMLYEFSTKVWTKYGGFLSCTENHQWIMQSRSEYEAAQVLRINGPMLIRSFSIGQIMHLINQSIWKKKWLRLPRTPVYSLQIDLQVVNSYLKSRLGAKPGVLREQTGFSTKKESTELPAVYDTSAKLMIFQKLRVWLLEISLRKSEYDISMIPKDFKEATGIHLDYKKLGYSNLQALIKEFSDIVSIKCVRKGLHVLCLARKKDSIKPLVSVNALPDEQPKTQVKRANVGQKAQQDYSQPLVPQDQLKQPVTLNNPTLEKVINFLLHMPNLKTGYDTSLIEEDFLKATGIILDCKALGYSSLENLISDFPMQFCLKNPKEGLFLVFNSNTSSEVSYYSEQVKSFSTDYNICNLKTLSHESMAGKGNASEQVPESIDHPFSARGFQQKDVSGTVSPQDCKELEDFLDIKTIPAADLTTANKETHHITGQEDTQELSSQVAGDPSQACVSMSDTAAGMPLCPTVDSGELYTGAIKALAEADTTPTLAACLQPKISHQAVDADELNQAGAGECSVKANNSQETIEKLRTWLRCVMPVVQDGYDLNEMYKDFLELSRRHLLSVDFDIDQLKSLLLQLSDTVWVRSHETGRCLAYPAGEKGHIMLKDVELLLLKLLSEHKNGYPMARLKQDFKLQYNYELEQSLAGFSKLQNLVKAFEFVEVKSSPRGADKMVHMKEPSII